MYSKLTIVGSLALASYVAALPVDAENLDKRNTYFKDYRGAHISIAAASSWSGWQGQATSTASAPASTSTVTFPLSDGFPNVQNPSPQLTAIELAAHGPLPNGPPPPSPPANDDVTSLRLIAFNEIFEVFYFTEILNFVTANAPGYAISDPGQRQQVINALTAVIAQEKEHALNANGALAHFNAGPIQACKYQIPPTVVDLKSAFDFARTFTDVVVGTLADVQTHFGQNGDSGLIRGVGSVIAQEGEQNGFYRNYLGLIPSAAPFLTASTREFAFSALNQNVVVAGSCPNINTIGLPVFGVLSLKTPAPIAPQDQSLSFSFEATGAYSQYATAWQPLKLVFINQQTVPIVADITGVQVQGTTVSFNAQLPYTANIMNGLTIAAVVDGTQPLTTVVQVAAAAKFGPALIEIN